jgi:two-component sensor histidine kinase
MAEPEDHGEETGFLRGGGATGEIIAQLDWGATALGPLAAWPQSLKTATAIVLRSPTPMMLLWGTQRTMLYNDPCSTLLGPRHPEAMGARVTDVWPEVANLPPEKLGSGLRGRPLSVRDRELTLTRGGERAQAWFDVDASPVLDESGRPAGVLVICRETTERVQARRQAILDFERQRRIFDQAPGFICVLRGPDLVVEYANEAHRRLFGGEGAVGKPYREAFAHLGAFDKPEVLRRVYATGVRHVSRAASLRVPKPGGKIDEHFVDLVLEPVMDDEGRVIGLFFEGFDVTEQVRAQNAAEESERRLSAAVTIARLGAFEWDMVTGRATMDDRAREIFGFGPTEDLDVDDVVGRIDARDLQRLHVEADAHGAARRTRREFEYHIHLPDGATRNIAAVSDIVIGAEGRTTRVVGVLDDVTEQRAAERRQRMLINELNHRVKNTLATVQSIAAQTLRSAPDLGAARDSFEARLVALAAAHDLLTLQNWHGARLADVAATAMAPFETAQRSRISRTGPAVWLTAQRALALSLALHELATNAAKYGALSTPGGHVAMRWRLAGKALTLTWTEEGGPPVAPPTRAGFGTRLLHRGLAHELHGEVVVTFDPEGVRCEIRCEVERAPPRPEAAIAGL